jgi:hypothetical protein
VVTIRCQGEIHGIQRATFEHRSFQATFEGQVFARKGKALRLIGNSGPLLRTTENTRHLDSSC